MSAYDDEPVTITPCKNGPLLVRGNYRIETDEGELVKPDRRTIALCRCGVSTIKPFCDGTHKLVKFRTDDESPT